MTYDDAYCMVEPHICHFDLIQSYFLIAGSNYTSITLKKWRNTCFPQIPPISTVFYFHRCIIGSESSPFNPYTCIFAFVKCTVATQTTLVMHQCAN